MVQLYPVSLEGGTALAVTVELPKTRLVSISTGSGYIMCGALDVHLLRKRLARRGIVAGRAVGVRTVEDLLAAPLESVTQAAEALGIHAGTSGRAALETMLAAEAREE